MQKSMLRLDDVRRRLLLQTLGASVLGSGTDQACARLPIPIRFGLGRSARPQRLAESQIPSARGSVANRLRMPEGINRSSRLLESSSSSSNSNPRSPIDSTGANQARLDGESLGADLLDILTEIINSKLSSIDSSQAPPLIAAKSGDIVYSFKAAAASDVDNNAILYFLLFDGDYANTNGKEGFIERVTIGTVSMRADVIFAYEGDLPISGFSPGRYNVIPIFESPYTGQVLREYAIAPQLRSINVLSSNE